MGIVYLLTNTKNGKRYVGKTTQSLEVRWGGHVGSARRGDNGMLICRALKRHGPEAFERKVLWEGNEKELPVSERELGEWEKHFIKELHAHVSEGGYNLTYGGDGGLSGYEFSDESREKIRQKALGRKLSPEARAKISAAHRGKKQSPEHVAQRAATNTGKKRTEEQRARISESLIGHTVSSETRVKIGIANGLRVVAESTKEKFRKKVEQLTPEGNLLVVHGSLTDAARAAGLSKGAMCGVVRLQKIYAGCAWRYQDQR